MAPGRRRDGPGPIPTTCCVRSAMSPPNWDAATGGGGDADRTRGPAGAHCRTGLDLSPADYYRERNRKIRRVLEAHFGKPNVSVTAGWEQGLVTARIDNDLGIGELIDLVR